MIFLLEEKTCRAEVFCTEQQHSMAEAGGEKFPLVFAFVGEYTQKLHDSLKEAVMPQIEAGKVRPFVLALYGPIEWDADYSPWYATALQGREFAGNAPQYLDFIQYRLLPYLKESFPLSGEVYTLGYSLGGLQHCIITLNWDLRAVSAVLVHCGIRDFRTTAGNRLKRNCRKRKCG